MGEITFQGNEHFNDRIVRRAIKNERPIGIPYSIFFENLFAKTYDSTKLEEIEHAFSSSTRTKDTSRRATDATVKIVDVGGGSSGCR